MTATIRLFARARDLAGSERISVELPEGATVRMLRSAIAESCPALKPLLPNLLVALGNQYATDTQPIPAGAEIACFPPVSGG